MRTLPILILAIIGVAYCYPVDQDSLNAEVETKTDLVKMGSDSDSDSDSQRVKRSGQGLEKAVEKIVSFFGVFVSYYKFFVLD